MVTADYKKPGTQFYIIWVLFSIVSGVTAFVAYVLIMKIYNAFAGEWIVVNGVTHIAEDYLLPYILWPIYAMLCGYLQYLLLRRYFPHMGWWILSTAIGLSLTFLGLDMGQSIASALGIDPYSVWLVVIQFTLVGGFMGAAQWLVLRGHIPNAIWWIPANMVGWGMAGFTKFLGVLGILVLPASIASFTLYILVKQNYLSPEDEK